MRRIHIRVIPNAKRRKIVTEGGLFKIYVNAPAVEGKANAAVIEALAEYFNVKKRHVKIIRGERSREKSVEITSP